MKKFVAMAFTCLLLAGCGASEQDRMVSNTFTELGNLSTKINQITKDVQEAIKSQKGNDAKGTENHLQQAVTRAEDLKKIGEDMQGLKVWAQRLKDKTSESAAKDLAARNRDRLAAELTKLDKEYQELESEITKAREQAGKSAPTLDLLRKKINDGLASFDLLNKQR